MGKNKLIIFTRYPCPGKTKTRLIPLLGPERAALLQRKMSEDTIFKAKRLSNSFPVNLTIFYEGGSREDMENWVGDIDIEKQKGKSLGDRIAYAFKRAFNEKAENVVIIGSDCPELSEEVVKESFIKLKDHDLVLGPAEDGGYYLIGLCREESQLFFDIEWGTKRVLEQTEKRAEDIGLTVAHLETLSDVDRPQDIKKFTNL